MIGYKNDFLPVWVRVWRLRSKVSLKPFPQNVHKYLFVSEWHFMWRFNNLWRLNTLEQRRHWNFVGSLDALVAFNRSAPRLGSTAAGVSFANGFFIPKPPFIISKGVSGLNPSWKRKADDILYMWNVDVIFNIKFVPIYNRCRATSYDEMIESMRSWV